MKKQLVFLLLLLIMISLLYAESQYNKDTDHQADTEQQRNSLLGLSIGIVFAGFREETIADVNRYLNAPVFSLHSIIEKNMLLHSHNALFFTGQNKLLIESPNYLFEKAMPEYYTFKDTYSRFFYEYSVTYRLWGNNILPGYLGGAFRTDIYLIETLDNPTYLNLTAALSFNLSIYQKWIINNKNMIVLTLGFPVIGYAVRPYYIGLSAWPLEKGILSFHNYLACFGNLRYYYKLTRFISLYTDIGFEASQIKFPKPRRDASANIKLGVVYTY